MNDDFYELKIIIIHISSKKRLTKVKNYDKVVWEKSFIIDIFQWFRLSGRAVYSFYRDWTLDVVQKQKSTSENFQI